VGALAISSVPVALDAEGSEGIYGAIAKVTCDRPIRWVKGNKERGWRPLSAAPATTAYWRLYAALNPPCLEHVSPGNPLTDLCSFWVQGPRLDLRRFCKYARLLPSHLPCVTQVISMLANSSVSQSSGVCPISRVGHAGGPVRSASFRTNVKEVIAMCEPLALHGVGPSWMTTALPCAT
jgi:hypothetical protein